MSITSFEKVMEFHKSFGVHIGNLNETFDDYDELNALRERILDEEYKEVKLAYANRDKANLVKELNDLKYVIEGWLITLGVDGDKSFDLVHQSNMSKLDEQGKPVLREDGKILKGPNYKAVNESDLLISF
jgi:predicted HAD superfamily Cof-like phosphohydrolase